jgi:ABC-type molybdate transport system substrate-binding protein
MQTKELVFTGKADATFIYAACATEGFKAADPERAVLGKAEVATTVPESSYDPMFAIVAIPSNAPNPELARQFIQFLLTPEAQQAMAKLGYGEMKTDAAAAKP